MKQTRVRTMQPKESGFIYAIIDESDRVKLGKAADVDRRLAELQTGNAEKLTIMYLWYVDSMTKAETGLHHIFAAYRVRGEWFKLDRKAKELLARIFHVYERTEREERMLQVFGL